VLICAENTLDLVRQRHQQCKQSDLAYRQENEGISHLYRLTVNPDKTAHVEVDEEAIYKGSLDEDWILLKPK